MLTIQFFLVLGPSSTGSFCGSKMRRNIAAKCTREERFQWASCSCVPEGTPKNSASSEKPSVFSSSTSRREFVEKSKTVVKKTDKTVVKETDSTVVTKDKTVVEHDRTVVVSSSRSGPRRHPHHGPRSSGPSSRGPSSSGSSPRPAGSSGNSGPSSGN